MRLANQVALVTGAAGALGRVVAGALAAEGARVAALDLDRDGLARTAELVRGRGSQAATAVADLVDPDVVTEAVARTSGELAPPGQGVDILVNCAGGGTVSPFATMPHQTWTAQIDRNLNSVFTATRAVLPGMLERGYGRIVSISSVAAISGGRLVRGATAYATAKAGIIGLTKALAIEVAEQGVTVNCLAPGAQATPARDGDSAERREQLLAQIPTRLLGRPEHLAEAVVFLASDAGRNITGVVLPLDGGHSI